MDPKGHIHPLTQVIWQTAKIFGELGFEVVEGPELEDEFHNFNALNIPADHPARDMQDTFWLKQPENFQFPLLRSKRASEGQAISNFQTQKVEDNKPLLRTQTSAIQIRYMETHKPPFRIIVPGGKVFRREATDASHEAQFHQSEGLYVTEKTSLAELKGTLNFFMDKFFGTDVKVRFRPSYFPFVEPAVEADITCFKCKGKDEHCSVCKGTGWIEILGAGMVHPNVLKAVGIDSKKWKGFAFSFGIDRLAMLKWGVEDIRLFYQSDIRFLEQF